MPKNPVCPHCGSRNVTNVEEFYRCEDCHSDFGRVPYSDDGVPMVDAVTGLRFRFGDFITGSVHLRFAQEDDDCLYEVYDANEGGIDKYADVLSLEEWTNLKKKLFENLYMYDWDRSFIPVNDGREIRGNNEWLFSIIVSEDEEYTYSGVDAYPVYWDRFMRVLEPFFKKLEQH